MLTLVGIVQNKDSQTIVCKNRLSGEDTKDLKEVQIWELDGGKHPQGRCQLLTCTFWKIPWSGHCCWRWHLEGFHEQATQPAVGFPYSYISFNPVKLENFAFLFWVQCLVHRSVILSHRQHLQRHDCHLAATRANSLLGWKHWPQDFTSIDNHSFWCVTTQFANFSMSAAVMSPRKLMQDLTSSMQSTWRRAGLSPTFNVFAPVGRPPMQCISPTGLICSMGQKLSCNGMLIHTDKVSEFHKSASSSFTMETDQIHHSQWWNIGYGQHQKWFPCRLGNVDQTRNIVFQMRILRWWLWQLGLHQEQFGLVQLRAWTKQHQCIQNDLCCCLFIWQRNHCWLSVCQVCLI